MPPAALIARKRPRPSIPAGGTSRTEADTGRGADASVRVIVPGLTSDCPQRESAALMERCDILFPELLKLFPPH